MTTNKRPLTFDGTTTRPMNDAEYQQHLADMAETELQAEALEAKLTARQIVLDKLGLTADEAAALFG